MDDNARLDKSELMKLVHEGPSPGPYGSKALIFSFHGRDVYANPGIPQMLLRSVSQFSNKSQEELTRIDAVKMYEAIQEICKEDVSWRCYEHNGKFRKEHPLSFFGQVQYELLTQYVEMTSD